MMDGSAIFVVLIPIFIIIAIVIRLAAGGMDNDRLREYVEQRGGQFISANWAPLGPGWFGEKSDRIYEVHYLDRDGNRHQAYAKTSMFTGVYFTEDQIIEYTKPPVDAREMETLEEENARLRMEIEKLKRKKGDDDSAAIRE